MQRYTISVVSYLNSKAFMKGLKDSAYMNEHATITSDIPSVCAEKVKSGTSDIGLIPVAVLPELGEYRIYSDYCIGAKGKVRSVFLFSDVPFDQITHIIADPHSRTSVTLTKVLCKYFWKIEPVWEKAKSEDYLNEVKSTTAAVMIGDRTFGVRDRFRYAYDLAEQWMLFTGLPFVFAVWAGRTEVSKEFLEHFNLALESGISRIEEVAAEQSKNYPDIDVKDYLTNNITFVLDKSKRKGLELFLSLLQKMH